MAEALPKGCGVYGIPGTKDASLVVHSEGSRTVAFEWRGSMWRPLRIPYGLAKRHGGLEKMFPFPCRMIGFDAMTQTGRFVRVGGFYWLSWLFWTGRERALHGNFRAMCVVARSQMKVKGWRPEPGRALSWRDVLLAGDEG